MSYARKYKFWEWVSDLPRAKRSEKLNEMAAVAGVSRRSLNTWVDAEAGSTLVCPFDSVLAICVLLGKDSGTVLNAPPAAVGKVTALAA